MIDDNNLQQLFTNIKNSIIDNKQKIQEIKKIDNKYCKIDINELQLVKLIDNFKHCNMQERSVDTVYIKYNGNPYISLNICILAILKEAKIVLDCNDNMLGINKFIIDIINNCIQTYNIKDLIQLVNNANIETVKNCDKIICIDDINAYNLYIRNEFKNVQFFSLNYIDFYSDSDELQELEETIYKYAEENEIPIEVYSELHLTEAIDMIKNGLGKKVLILTKNDKTKKAFYENIKHKELYINKNPFNEMIPIIKTGILL